MQITFSPRLLIIIVVIVVIAATILSCYHLINPRDRVKVRIENLPTTTVFICIVVDNGRSIAPIYWFPRGIVPPPFTIHPATASWSYVTSEDKRLGIAYHVKWRSGLRHGIITRCSDGKWYIRWFPRMPTYCFDLATVPPLPLSRELFDELGLSKVEDRIAEFGTP